MVFVIFTKIKALFHCDFSNVPTLNIVINCFCNLNQVDLGFFVFGKILKLGYEPDITTFTTLIKGLCLNGNVASTVKFFDEIVEKGF
ncbi:unnamed protein product [Camellia sinensis]